MIDHSTQTTSGIDVSASSHKPVKRGIPLRRTLFLSVGGLLVMLLLGNAILNVYTARQYLQSQLQSHAEDAVTALGMSISAALAEGDEVTAATVIDAVFDRGYYEHVILWDAKQKPWIVRHETEMPESVPPWLVEIMQLEGRQAISDVTSGWKRLGSVSVKVHPGLLYEKLWHTLKIEMLWFAGIFLLSVFSLMIVIRRTTQPIKSLVDMAKAIGEGNYKYQSTPEGSMELKQLATAMNEMAAKIQRMNAEQLDVIESLRNKLQIDQVSGALNREEFDRRFQAILADRDNTGQGQLVLVQVKDFSGFNNKYGRNLADQFLEKLYVQFINRANKTEGYIIGRRTGADFICYLPNAEAPVGDKLAESMVQAIAGMREIRKWCRDDVVHAGVVSVYQGNKISEVLANVDIALRNAQQAGNNGWQRFYEESNVLPLEAMHKANEWREAILAALQDDTIKVHYQPVYSGKDEHVVYSKALSRLDFGDELVNAGVFMPMAERFGLVVELDKAVLTKVMQHLDKTVHYGLRIGVSISTESLQSPGFLGWLRESLSARPVAAHCLFFEVSEFLLQRESLIAEQLVKMAADTGFTLVIDRFGQSSLPFSYLQSLPLKWIKLDRSLLHDIENRPDGRFYIQSITQIAHSQEVKVVAFGVENEAEWQLLRSLGIDAGAGYGLQVPVEDLSELSVPDPIE